MLATLQARSERNLRRVVSSTLRGLSCLAVVLCTACSGHSQVAIAEVDVERVVTHWPQMQSQSDELVTERRALAQTANVLDAGARARAQSELDVRTAELQIQISRAVRAAAERIAHDRHIPLVVTRDYVAYGGVDITDDVTKLLIAQRPDPNLTRRKERS